MPVLAVYIGAHDVTALVNVSQQESYYYTFPYVYSRSLYGNISNESDFYKNLFENFCKQSKVKLSECDVLVTGFLEPPFIDANLKSFVSIDKVLQKIEGYFPILINNYGVVTPEKTCSCQINTINGESGGIEPDEAEFYANLIVYPQIIVSDLVARADLDQNILDMVGSYSPNIPRPKQVVFMGSRFNQYNNTHELNHLLMLNLIRQPGIYQLFVDSDNSFILTQLIKMYYGYNVDIDPKPLKIGTLITAKNNIECMISTQVGTSQIIDLEKNKIFIMPLSKDERAKIVLKITGSSTVDEYITGGTQGIIFDTRENKSNLVSDFKTFSASLKVIGESGGMSGI